MKLADDENIRPDTRKALRETEAGCGARDNAELHMHDPTHSMWGSTWKCKRAADMQKMAHKAKVKGTLNEIENQRSELAFWSAKANAKEDAKEAQSCDL